MSGLRAAATCHQWVPCLWVEVWAMSPALPNKVQSDNRCYTCLYHHMWWSMFHLLHEMEINLTRTQFWHMHCSRWHISHWKKPLHSIWHWGICPPKHGVSHSADPFRHPSLYSWKLGNTATLSSLSSRWSHILDCDTPSSDDHFFVIFTGECWMATGTAVLCDCECVLCGYTVTFRPPCTFVCRWKVQSHKVW